MPLALIAGAGIGGLAAALAVRRAGWTVRILERASSPSELGFDLMLAANAMAALRELGLADAVASAGATIDSVSVRTGVMSRPRSVDLGPIPPSLRPIIASRQALHGALLDAVGQEAITFGAEAAGFHVAGARAVLELRDGRTFSGDVLIGADGVGSVIRRRLHPDAPLRPSGLVGMRGVAHGVDALLDVSLAMGFTRGADSGMIRGAGGVVYWFVSARDGRIERAYRDARPVADEYGAAFGDPLTSIVQATAPGDLRCEALVDGDPLPHWGRGPITLLGDAAHPMLPHAGQGAAQALEDAVALGLALRAGADAVTALRRYEDVRARRTEGVVRLSRRLSRVRTSRSAAVALLRAGFIHLVPAAVVHLARLLRPGDPHAALRP